MLYDLNDSSFLLSDCYDNFINIHFDSILVLYCLNYDEILCEFDDINLSNTFKNFLIENNISFYIRYNNLEKIQLLFHAENEYNIYINEPRRNSEFNENKIKEMRILKNV